MEIDNAQAEQILTHSLKTWFKLGKIDMNVSFMGVEDDTTYFSEIPIPKNENEITITKPLAEKLNIKVGDKIVFKDDYYDKEYKLKVANICDYKGSLTAFVGQDELNRILGNLEGTYNAYVSNEKLEIGEEYLAKSITRDDMVGTAKELMKTFESVMGIINIFAVVVYMIIMYILTKTVIEKNTIPIEVLSFKYILVLILSKVEGYIPFYLPLWLYISIIVIGIVSYFVINTLHVRKIKRISMTEALKNRE